MGKTEQGRKGRAAGAALVPFALFAVFFWLWGAAGEETLPGVFLAEVPLGGCETLLLEEWGNSSLFACSGLDGALLLRLDSVTGKELARAELDRPLVRAAFRDGALFTWEDRSGSVRLTAYSPETLEESFTAEVPARLRDLLFFDCGGAGEAYTVRAGATDTLARRGPDGAEERRAFPAGIEFLGVTQGGRVCVYAGGRLYRSEPGRFDRFQELSMLAVPHKLLGEERVLDTDGVVSLVGEAGLQPLLQCPEPLLAPLFYSLDREFCLILSNGAEKLYRLLPAGAMEEYGVLEGRALAVCGAGAVYQKESGLYYAPAVPEGEPPPSVSPSPEHPEFPSELRVEGDLLLVPEGTTAARLRSLFEPEAVLIRKPSGEPASGRLATGMTAGGYLLVVPGDCDGNGSVGGADVREAHAMRLGPEKWGRAYRRAADLDGDGRVDAFDVVLLSVLALS